MLNTASKSIPVRKPSLMRLVRSLTLSGPMTVNTAPPTAHSMATITAGTNGRQNVISFPIDFLKLTGFSGLPVRVF